MTCAKQNEFSMPDHATIYISDPSLLGSRLFNQIHAIHSYQDLSEGEVATGILFDIGVAQIQMNFMPQQELSTHLNGFAGYARKVFSGEEDDLIYLLSRIRYVSFAMGSVISPGFDQQGNVEAFLLDFTSRLNGLLFIHNSIVDHNGQPLAGPLANSPRQ
jgi:hypothetical protein